MPVTICLRQGKTACHSLAPDADKELRRDVELIRSTEHVDLDVLVLPSQDDTRLPMLWIRGGRTVVLDTSIQRSYGKAVCRLLDFADKHGLLLRIDCLNDGGYTRVSLRSYDRSIVVLRSQTLGRGLPVHYNILRYPWPADKERLKYRY